MTKDRFLELLKKTGKYDVKGCGALRRCEDGYCPILAVYKDQYNHGEESMKYSNEDAYLVGRRILALTEEVTCSVIGAADNCYEPLDVKTRTELLTTIGLI